ncbi:RteC domain-containing protein [Capnocytophaga canimorsus]|nr:RteC domain-containing protein [Capnocytophaga canimorsus]AWL77983.1 tetracycline regulation of excision, RteC [Capnocytophaga canimorsus]AYW36619.1 tetracycline regulation of excision, RteC [Capnocytophaga canimorsus]MDT9499288.1 RteC domain-containing protein [Capnocytophaga canimorsus]
MNTFFYQFLLKIKQEEQKVSFLPESCVEESLQMMSLLSDMLKELKIYVLDNGFDSQKEEIIFFRDVKPVVQGKWLFYHQLYQWEAVTSVLSKAHLKDFFVQQGKKIEKDFKICLKQNPFYNYYLSENHSWDDRYFVRYQINVDTEGLPENMLNFDADFSTYYDFLVAQILCKKQLGEYFSNRITDLEGSLQEVVTDLEWTATKNDLIELVYALQHIKAISYGKMSINKIIAVFGKIFNIDLKDSHHAFHRMKTRAKSKTAFLDELKKTLEEYMDR